MEQEMYEVVIQCENCREVITLSIEKGIYREDFTEQAVCPNCECELWEHSWVFEGEEE